MKAEQSDVNVGMQRGGKRAEFNLDHLTHNYQTVSKLISHNSRMMAIVKGDAYGHGLIPISRHLNELGVRDFAVSDLDDAIQLRVAGIQGRILHIGVVETERIPELFDFQITPSICSYAFAEELSAVAIQLKQEINVQIRMDQGLGTVGIAELDTIEIAMAIRKLQGLRIEALYTQIPGAYQNLDEPVRAAIRRFDQIGTSLKQQGLPDLLMHAASSPMIMNFPEGHFDYVRVGIVLFGLKCIGFESVPLKPVMQMKAHVVQIRTMAIGECFGYDSFRNDVPDRRIATVQIGYGDAMFLIAIQEGHVLIRGKRVPILGKCTMDHLFVDIQALDEVCVGDEVVIIGQQNEESITAEEVAEKSGFNEYNAECITMYVSSISRFYRKGGVEVGDHSSR